MNIEKLKDAESRFFEMYPGGFLHPEMQKIGAKHQPAKMTALAQVCFQKDHFKTPNAIVESMVKIVSRSSMVSVFEKPRFKEFVLGLAPDEADYLSLGLKNFLYGDEETGFEQMVRILKQGQLAKWSCLTICPAYFRPTVEVFIKPTTAKQVIDYFELDGLHYQSTPTYSFYKSYRAIINQMKREVDSKLSPGNAEFCGFLMMTMG